ncbi:MAG: peptidase M23 [Pseudomonadota bacterium]
MKRLVKIALGLAFLGSLASAQDADSAAEEAAERLRDATNMLAVAERAQNRVKALTETVRAFEDGLDAVREGMRQAAIQEQALSKLLGARHEEIAQLLGVLQTIGQNHGPVLLLHPSGPLGTARSGMIVSKITPALESRAAELRVQLREVSTLRALQESASGTLERGLLGAQEARAALSKAIADRTDLPRRFIEDTEKTKLLIAAAETLEGFASGLSSIAIDEVSGSLPSIADRKGALSLPAEGRILRTAGEADAAGIVRPGIVLAVRPFSIVTTPVPATLRYHGPLLDYGNVVILEPQAGILLVLAGLDVVYGSIGEVLPGGSPVGLMGGELASEENDTLLIDQDDQKGAQRTQTLYIEVRENSKPVDPEMWFQTNEG